MWSEMNYIYDKERHSITLDNYSGQILIFDKSNEEIKNQFRKLISYTLHQKDMEFVVKCLDKVDNISDDVLRIAIVNHCIVRIVRCFSGGKDNPGISLLDANKIPVNNKGEEPKKVYDKLEGIRNKYIAHGDGDFETYNLGILYNSESRKVDGYISPKYETSFVDAITVKTIKEFANRSLIYINSVLENEQKRFERYIAEKDSQQIEQYVSYTI